MVAKRVYAGFVLRVGVILFEWSLCCESEKRKAPGMECYMYSTYQDIHLP